MIVLMLFWVDFAFLARVTSDQSSLSMFFLKIAWFVTPIFFLSLYFFTIYLIKESHKYRFLSVAVFLAGTIISILTGLTSLILNNVRHNVNGLEIIYGQGMFLFLISIFFIICSTLYPLIKKYSRISAKKKIKIGYFLIGIFIFYFANIVFNIIFPLFFNVFHLYYFGDYSIIILLIFTTYAITKHELMGIKTLITQTLIVIISIILLVDVFLLSDDIVIQLSKVGVLVTFLYFSRELIKSVKKEKEIVKELKSAYRKINHYIKRLEKGNKNLEKSNQRFKELLEMKNEFLHITSHQLRTPLTAIRGMLSMWYKGDFENLPEKEKKKMIKRILVSADRLNNITNDMLDTMELEGMSLKFKFKSVSIARIIKETIDTLKPNFDKKNIYIKLKINTKVSDAEVEPNYIRQVFMNIIDNACKYTKKGGVSINIEKDDKYIKVIVKDTGAGISKVDQIKIFDKFTRGENAISENASGSGLGLFIAKRIIKEHKGKIKMESEGIGKGSTVKIYLRISNN
ncbi:MAG: ATP-binding protein [Patescibacteria group bacterium]|nr:ATP-binding protein [Patescibacteria group bacterium]